MLRSIENNPFLAIDGADDAPVRVLFAHGAGAGKNHEFMQDMATRLASESIQVIRFDFPYMQRRAEEGRQFPPDRMPKLLTEFERLIDLFADGRPLFLMGKSMGGRMASHLTERSEVTGVICLGFPFHPPKNPEKYKGEHLRDIQKPTLILQGERDTFGTREECQTFDLSSSITLDFIADGDHSFKPRVKSGHTESSNRAHAITRIQQFILSLTNASD